MSKIIRAEEFLQLIKNKRRFLLIAPPVYDFRLEWAQWHIPGGLLKIAAYLLTQEKDVQLIDCLSSGSRKRVPRHKIGSVEIDGYRFHRWHFGLAFEDLEAEIRNLIERSWLPDAVLVTSLNSIWWEGVRDTINLVKNLLPNAKVFLGGAYPSNEPEHAAAYSSADMVVTGNVFAVANRNPNLALYSAAPYSTGIYFYRISKRSQSLQPRAASRILKEIREKTERGVKEFIFFDEEIIPEDRDDFGNLLDLIAKSHLDVHFVLPGNISPRTITQSLAAKMRRARVTQIYLRCDVQFLGDKIRYGVSLEEYQRCVNALIKKGGFRPREQNLAAMHVVGLPYENLDEVSERLIRLAQIVGSVILVPFQYVPSKHTGLLFDRALTQNGSFSPEKFNSKLFLLGRLSGKSIEEYLELTRLAALLNSKYRSKTFDFLGDSLAARLFREAIRTEGWNPFKASREVVVAPEIALLDSPPIVNGGVR